MKMTPKTNLKRTLDEYAKDMHELINIKPTQFDALRIGAMISETPRRKWNAAQAYVDTTLDRKNAEQNLKAIRAQKMMQVNHSSLRETYTNAEDRKAWVDNDEEVQAAELAVIEAEATQLASKLGYECLDDLFTAGKKIMDYITQQDRAEGQYNRFAREAQSGN